MSRIAWIARVTTFALAALLTAGCMGVAPAAAEVYKDPRAKREDRVADLLSRMTLEEKIGQMTQVARDYIANPSDIAVYGFGSILSGGGSGPDNNTPKDWVDMIDGYQRIALGSRLGIPMLYGVDAVHGNNNVRGAVIFPHNIGLGATRDPDIVRQAARITAFEMVATGARWDFAPCVTVPQDARWGRTYEGFGSDPDLVSRLAAAAIAGYQAGGLAAPGTVLATAKHFVADGGTEGGVDRGNARITDEILRAVHLKPYIDAIASGAESVMASYSSINGVKNHANRDLLTGVLRKELGFSGFVVSDWAAAKELPGSPREQVKTAVNAGVDMFMLPDCYTEFSAEMLDLVNTGEVSGSRVDEAVRRILSVKFQMGLFEKPFADRSLLASVGSPEHRAIARRAVRESLVLLKNEGRVLPIGPKVKRILVTGSLADDLGGQCGGWTITWQGGSGPVTKGTTILDGIREVAGRDVTVLGSPDGRLPAGQKAVDLVLVVVGERPYAETKGDSCDLALSSTDKAALQAARSNGAPVVLLIVSGRPLIVTSELAEVDALVAAWLPGTEGGGVADVLFGREPFRGKLPVPWPKEVTSIPDGLGEPLFPFGAGLAR